MHSHTFTKASMATWAKYVRNVYVHAHAIHIHFDVRQVWNVCQVKTTANEKK